MTDQKYMPLAEARKLTGVLKLGGVALAFLVAALLAATLFAQEPPVTLEIHPEENEVVSGDTLILTATLQNVSANSLQNIQLTGVVTAPLRDVRARGNVEASSGVRSDGLRTDENRVRWRGDLQTDGRLLLNIAVRTTLCTGENRKLTLNAAVGPASGDPVVSAERTVAVICTEELDPQMVPFESMIRLQEEDDNSEGADATIELFSNQNVSIVVTTSNPFTHPIYALITGQFAPVEADGRRCTFVPDGPLPQSDDGIQVPKRALPENADFGVVQWLLPASSSAFSLRGSAVGEPDCSITSEMRLRVLQAHSLADESSLAPPPLNTNFLRLMLELPNKLGDLLTFRIIGSDLGDAPDSTNHFGVNMTAYASGEIATFPTVFDPSTGAPSGPKHLQAQPLHLGESVSKEREADRGAFRNLEPPGDGANLDLADDGVDPSVLNFNHCIPTTIPVAVTLNQAVIDEITASDGEVYLNVWLDGNHDGDWEDTLDCDGLTGSEHIVVDQALAPTVPGTHPIMASTRNIAIPVGGEDKAMWLRVTLSDEPSVKTGQIQDANGQPLEIGDGRGPNGGYRWGETEDYLYIPEGLTSSEQTSDLALEAEMNIVTDPQDTLTDAASVETVNSVRYRAFAKIQIQNRGRRFADEDARLEIELDTDIESIFAAETLGWRGCLTCTLASGSGLALDGPFNGTESAWKVEANADPDLPIQPVCTPEGVCKLQVGLAGMPAGASTTAVIGWFWDGSRDSEVRAVVQSGEDGDPSNNMVNQTARTPLAPLQIAGPGNGTVRAYVPLTATITSSGGAGENCPCFEVHLVAEPGSTVALFADGANLATVDADENGSARLFVALPEGEHYLSAAYQSIPSVDAERVAQLARSDPRLISVVFDGFWDPASFGFTQLHEQIIQTAALLESDDSCGPWSFQNSSGHHAFEGWEIPLAPGVDHELTVAGFCDAGRAQIALKFGSVEVNFADEDGDGLHTAVVNAQQIGSSGLNGVDAVLEVICGAETSVNHGTVRRIEPAVVTDATTDIPLAGMEALLLKRSSDVASAEAVPFAAHVHGQQNPQTTGVDGAFSFVVPDGRYGLAISGAGYQPFRVGPFDLQGAFPSRSFGLTPVPEADTKATVQITEEGFVPSAIRIEPGSVVEWTNLSFNEANLSAGTAEVTVAGTNSSFDSGLLRTGAAYQFKFEAEGTYIVTEEQDPSRQTTIIVTTSTDDPAAPATGQTDVYLPVTAQ